MLVVLIPLLSQVWTCALTSSRYYIHIPLWLAESVASMVSCLLSSHPHRVVFLCSLTMEYDNAFAGRAVAQPGSAPVWGTGGRGFKSRRPDQRKRPFFGGNSPSIQIGMSSRASLVVDVAQPVRALVCGTRGCGFKSRLPPQFSILTGYPFPLGFPAHLAELVDALASGVSVLADVPVQVRRWVPDL